MGRLMMMALAAAGLTACSSPPTARQTAQDAVTAMGGREKLEAVQTIVMKGGTGTRTGMGQTRRVADAETAGDLKNTAEIADLAGGRASLDYELNNAGFMQHRHEILTKRGDRPVGIEIVGMRPVIATSPSGLFSWGTQNSPEFLLRRNIITIALAAADSASAALPPDDKIFIGKMSKALEAKTKAGERVIVYFDPVSKLPLGFEVIDTETCWETCRRGTLADTRPLTDHAAASHHDSKGGRDYSMSSSRRSPSTIRPRRRSSDPEAAAKETDMAIAAGDYSPVELTKIADGLYFARAYSHNSMIVEFPAFLAVVEAPYTEAQSKTLVRMLREQFPGKPVRYAAVTHHHYDHTGGVRGIAAAGATILVEKGHELVLRAILDARHTHPPDDLDNKRSAQPPLKTGSIEVYEGKKVVADSGQRLELYAFSGSPHVEPMVLAYVPRGRALFQSDLWFPGTNGTGNPAAKQLLDSI